MDRARIIGSVTDPWGRPAPCTLVLRPYKPPRGGEIVHVGGAWSFDGPVDVLVKPGEYDAVLRVDGRDAAAKRVKLLGNGIVKLGDLFGEASVEPDPGPGPEPEPEPQPGKTVPIEDVKFTLAMNTQIRNDDEAIDFDLRSSRFDDYEEFFAFIVSNSTGISIKGWMDVGNGTLAEGAHWAMFKTRKANAPYKIEFINSGATGVLQIVGVNTLFKQDIIQNDTFDESGFDWTLKGNWDMPFLFVVDESELRYVEQSSIVLETSDSWPDQDYQSYTIPGGSREIVSTVFFPKYVKGRSNKVIGKRALHSSQWTYGFAVGITPSK